MRIENFTNPLIRKHAQFCIQGTNNTIFSAAISVPLNDVNLKLPEDFSKTFDLDNTIKSFYDYKLIIGMYQRLWDFTIISICSDIEYFIKDFYELQLNTPKNNGFYQRFTSVISDLSGKGLRFDSINNEIANINIAFQIRHLLIHNFGIIDQKFLNNTNLNLNLGEKLIITEKEYKNSLNAYNVLLTTIDKSIKN